MKPSLRRVFRVSRLFQMFRTSRKLFMADLGTVRSRFDGIFQIMAVAALTTSDDPTAFRLAVPMVSRQPSRRPSAMRFKVKSAKAWVPTAAALRMSSERAESENRDQS